MLIFNTLNSLFLTLFPTKDSSIHCPEARSRIGRLLNQESDIATCPSLKPCVGTTRVLSGRSEYDGRICNGESGNAKKIFSASYLLELSTASLAPFLVIAYRVEEVQGRAKKNPAKFGDTCSVRADGLCIGCLGQWAERGREN